MAANGRLADPVVGVYRRPGRVHEAVVLFVPEVGLAVADQGPHLPCYGDTVMPPLVQRSGASRAQAGEGYRVDVSMSCAAGPIVYPLARGGWRLLFAEVDAYVDAFNATEGAAEVNDFSWVKVQPPTRGQGTDTELPAAVRARLFRVPLTMTVLSVQAEARTISMPMAGLPPRSLPGHRLTAQVDRGAADRLSVGLQLWRQDRCANFRVTRVDERTAMLEIDTPGDPAELIAPGMVLSTSNLAMRRQGPCW